jgi:Tol biopolymer transport system component
MPDISPDGQWVAFCSAGKQEDIFVVRTDGAELHQLTEGTHMVRMPRWAPDGKQIAFFSDRSGKVQIWAIKPDGSGLRQITDDHRSIVQAPFWSPDGARLGGFRQTVREVFVMDVAKPWKDQAPQNLPPLNQANGYFNPSAWSPDGRKVAGFQMGVDARFDGIVVYSFSARHYERLTEFGHVPRWLGDSRRLLFNHAGKLYLVDSRTKKVHEVAAVPLYEINPWHFGISSDNRLIVFSLAVTEADVWLATLAE